MSRSSEHKALLAELDRHRNRVGDDLDGLNESLDFNQRFRNSVQQHPGWWIGGGLAAGMILSRLLIPGRTSRRGGETSGKKKGGFSKSPAFLGLLGIAAKEILRISTPALKEVAGRQLEQWINDRRPPTPGDKEKHEIIEEESG